MPKKNQKKKKNRKNPILRPFLVFVYKILVKTNFPGKKGSTSF